MFGVFWKRRFFKATVAKTKEKYEGSIRNNPFGTLSIRKSSLLLNAFLIFKIPIILRVTSTEDFKIYFVIICRVDTVEFFLSWIIFHCSETSQTQPPQ